jgi:hypothetical protein
MLAGARTSSPLLSVPMELLLSTGTRRQSSRISLAPCLALRRLLPTRSTGTRLAYPPWTSQSSTKPSPLRRSWLRLPTCRPTVPLALTASVAPSSKRRRQSSCRTLCWPSSSYSSSTELACTR